MSICQPVFCKFMHPNIVSRSYILLLLLLVLLSSLAVVAWTKLGCLSVAVVVKTNFAKDFY